MGRLIPFLIVVLLSSALAHADGDSSTKQRARLLFKEGEALYQAGEYKNAIEKYRAAYDLVPQPLLLFDLAQANRLDHQPDLAVDYYRRYLDVEPNGRAAIEARARIEELTPAAEVAAAERAAREKEAADAGEKEAAARRETERRAAAQAEPAHPELVVAVAPAPKRPVWKKGWFWGTLVGAAVVVGGAVALGVILGGERDPAPSYGHVSSN